MWSSGMCGRERLSSIVVGRGVVSRAVARVESACALHPKEPNPILPVALRIKGQFDLILIVLNLI